MSMTCKVHYKGGHQTFCINHPELQLPGLFFFLSVSPDRTLPNREACYFPVEQRTASQSTVPLASLLRHTSYFIFSYSLFSEFPRCP